MSADRNELHKLLFLGARLFQFMEREGYLLPSGLINWETKQKQIINTLLIDLFDKLRTERCESELQLST